MVTKKPTKQRNLRSNALNHEKGQFMRAMLSDELSKKFGKKNARVIKGDKVKILRGQFKGKSGKVETVNTKTFKVTITDVDLQKTDGTKVKYPIYASNLVIVELNMDDKKRQEILKRK